MPELKERSKTEKAKGGKVRAKAPLTQQQAAKLLRDKYVQQLDQRPESGEGQTDYAVGQVEAAERFAADELTWPRSPRQRTRSIKKKSKETAKEKGKRERANRPDRAQPQKDVPPQETPAPCKEAPEPREQAANAPRKRAAQSVKTRSAVEGAQTDPPHSTTRQSTDARPAQRTWTIKERRTQEIKTAEAPHIKEHPPATIHQSIKSIPDAAAHPAPADPARPATATPSQSALNSAKQKLSASRRQGEMLSVPAKDVEIPSPGRKAIKAPASGRASAPKVRGSVYAKSGSSYKTARNPMKTAAARPLRGRGPTIRQRMTREAIKQRAKQVWSGTKKAAMTKRAVEAVAKAATAVGSFLSTIIGGGVLLLALMVVVIIGAVVSSPFGLFFAEERTAPDTVSVAEAVSSVNIAYNGTLETLQAGDYDSVDLTGSVADWADVLAVFAVRHAGAENGVDVATLDADRVDKLTTVFWDMTTVTSTVETIDHPDSDPDDDVDDSWTERILHITVIPKSADEMRTVYGFTNYQNSALDELLSDRASLASLAGSLNIVNVDALAVLNALPDDLSEERRAVVKTALQLYGKVNYFWGGKSRVIGWDSRWGTLQKVTAAGSVTTGTYRPYGLDCSGFVDWVFYNVTDGGYLIGHGGGAATQHTCCTAIAWDAAQPGDLVFYPDDEHVGIVCGWDEGGNLLVIHCASSPNNVVITGTSGFTSIGRPVYYGE